MVSDTNDILIFDRALRQRRKQRIACRFHDHSFLTDWAARLLADRLHDVNRRFPLALQLGADSTAATFTASGKIDRIITMDNAAPADIVGDAEFIPFAAHTADLIYSTLNLHSVNDLPGMLLQIKKTLKPDGLFIASMFGGETLHELRQSLMQAELDLKGGASPRVFPFADKQQMGALLQRAGFALPVVDSEIVTVTYENIFRLMHDLRGMGESNIIRGRHKTNPGRALFLRAAEHYHRNYAETDGRIRASFEIIFLTGWSPHASQQKPLAPGSAKARLADALQTHEIKTGERAAP